MDAGTTATIRNTPMAICQTSIMCAICTSGVQQESLCFQNTVENPLHEHIESKMFICIHYIKNLKLSTLGFPFRFDLRFAASLPQSN